MSKLVAEPPSGVVHPSVNSIGAETLASVRNDYEADDAAVIRDLIPHEWFHQLAEGTDQLLASDAAHNFSRPGDGRFVASIFAYLRQPQYRAFIMDSDIGKIAADLMGAKSVRFFFDQPVIKEPRTPKRTPWHQDSAYWPVTGRQVLSIWVPLDPASTANGVVTYVKGSHKWKAFYPAESWSDNAQPPPGAKPAEVSELEYPGPGGTAKQPRTLADIRDHPENYEFTKFSLEPGDVLIHQMETFHGAPGNLSQNTRRRAIAFRFLGDDARWDNSRPTFLRTAQMVVPNFPASKLEKADPITDPLLPLVWSATERG